MWSRGGYTPGFEYVKKILRIVLGKKIPSSAQRDKRDQVISYPIISKIWLIIAMVDLVLYYGIFIRFKLLLGEIFICDRYLGDTYLDFSLNFKHVDLDKMLIWKFLILITPKPNKSFVILIPVNESIQRSKLKKEPFPDSKKVLEDRLIFYKESSFFKGASCQLIDGMESLESINRLIEFQVFNELNKTNAS